MAMRSLQKRFATQTLGNFQGYVMAARHASGTTGLQGVEEGKFVNQINPPSSSSFLGMRSLQKQFATHTLGTFQGYGLLQRLQTLQNTRNVMPARHASSTTELKGVEEGKKINPPSSGSFLGIFENKAMSVEEIEAKLVYPVKIIGTRKPFQFWFYEWDLNVALIRDFLNPRLYLTFQDSNGTIVGPVAYNASFISWGAKIEFGVRNRIGYLGALKGISLESIPKRLDMGFGWDFGGEYRKYWAARDNSERSRQCLAQGPR
jgi:hypothetical protein